MDDLVYWLFLVNIGWLTAHELDAIQQHEWRIFPATAALDDVLGYRIFVAVHIPLLAVVIWFATEDFFQIIFDLFLIAHVGLHWLFRNHPQYEFRNRFSQLLIVGGAPLGMLHLILSNV